MPQDSSQDTQLQQAVLAEFAWEPSVTAAHIGVTARGGIVTLTGHAESFARKQAAEAAARRVRGVKAMAEEIEVRLPSDMRRGDEDIAAAVVNGLAWDVSVPRGSVRVQVEDGWVTLSGQVDWNYQRDVVGRFVRTLLGVRGVLNEVTIKTKVNAADLSNGINHALHRSWHLSTDDVQVRAAGGTVHLTGTAHSPHDRDVAAATACAAPGATAVVNDIKVIYPLPGGHR